MRGLLRWNPNLEIVQASPTLTETPDPELLEWATQNGYILISEDRNTLVGFYYERLKAELHSEGVFILRRGASLGEIIESLKLLIELSTAEEWSNQVTYIPLQ